MIRRATRFRNVTPTANQRVTECSRAVRGASLGRRAKRMWMLLSLLLLLLLLPLLLPLVGARSDNTAAVCPATTFKSSTNLTLCANLTKQPQVH